jgi:hypothetical protein
MQDPRLQDDAAGRVIVCDECSMLGNEQLRWLLEFAQERDCRLLLVGDPKQCRLPGRGYEFQHLVQDDAVPLVRLEGNYRQEDPEYREAVNALSRGQWGKGLDLLEGMGAFVESASYLECLERVIDDAFGAIRAGAKPSEVGVLVLRHEDARAVAERLEAKLREAGLLGREEKEIRRLEPVHLSDAQRGDAASYREGMVVQFHTATKAGFESGSRHTVRASRVRRCTRWMLAGLSGRSRWTRLSG